MKTKKQRFCTYLIFSIFLFTGLSFQSVYGQDQWESFGEEITEDDALSASDALPQFSEAGEMVKIEGEITAVCEKAGCWAQFVTDNNEQIRIKFKNYGFFIPVEAAGRQMIAEGVAFKMPVSDKDESEETATSHKYEFIAEGVLLSK